MNKNERLAYMLSKKFDLDPIEAIGEISATRFDIDDELSLSAAFQEHKRTSNECLTSDER